MSVISTSTCNNSCSCLKSDVMTQPFPRSGHLFNNRDRALKDLRQSKLPDGKVFTYVLSSVEVVDGRFIQYGCAPNFQGGLITLCTCMHYHRTWWKSWLGVWVAGFCGINNPGGNQLFYLMRVSNEFLNQYELWQSPTMRASREAKSARHQIFGDVYQPQIKADDQPYNPDMYFAPREGHRHHRTSGDDNWHDDIYYRDSRRPNAPPKLLVGDSRYSFLWATPRCSFTGKQHPRCKVYPTLGAFMDELK